MRGKKRDGRTFLDPLTAHSLSSIVLTGVSSSFFKGSNACLSLPVLLLYFSQGNSVPSQSSSISISLTSHLLLQMTSLERKGRTKPGDDSGRRSHRMCEKRDVMKKRVWNEVWRKFFHRSLDSMLLLLFLFLLLLLLVILVLHLLVSVLLLPLLTFLLNFYWFAWFVHFLPRESPHSCREYNACCINPDNKQSV